FRPSPKSSFSISCHCRMDRERCVRASCEAWRLLLGSASLNGSSIPFLAPPRALIALSRTALASLSSPPARCAGAGLFTHAGIFADKLQDRLCRRVAGFGDLADNAAVVSVFDIDDGRLDLSFDQEFAQLGGGFADVVIVFFGQEDEKRRMAHANVIEGRRVGESLRGRAE